jgi:hypothetical protein
MFALDLRALRLAPVIRDPFTYLIVPGFVKAGARPTINADFPRITQPGSFPIGRLRFGPAFRTLIDELYGEEMREICEEKFGLYLKNRPTMLTVRGQCRSRDGQIHTDTASKLITALIYLNPTWEQPGGRLRLLRSATDIDDVAVEVPPQEGTLLIFRRCDHSFHGHKSFAGERRVVQLNWITNRRVLLWEQMRHRLSAMVKSMQSAQWGSVFQKQPADYRGQM